eukprot:4838246-Pyramimonas_sp.AAC.1
MKVASTLQKGTDGDEGADVRNIKCSHKKQPGDILDDLWENPFQQGKVKAAADPNKPKPTKIHKAKDPAAKRQLEYNESEQVIFRCKQLLSMIQTKFSSVAMASIKKLQKDMKGRMTDPLMEFYRQDLVSLDSRQPIELEGRSGTEILEDLTAVSEKIDAWLAIKNACQIGQRPSAETT